MRKHWFFDEEDKYSVKTKDKLFKLYYNTVGNNSCLMLGLSPSKRGVIEDPDKQILTAFGKDLKIMFSGDIVSAKGKITASSVKNDNIADNVKTNIPLQFWRPDENDKHPQITIEFEAEELFDKVVLQENIAGGQHIEEFEVFFLNEKNKWKSAFKGGVVGYKRICPLKPMKTKGIKIVFEEYRDFFEISRIQIN